MIGLLMGNSYHSEMALFPMSGVLRGFTPAVPNIRLGTNPCAALLIKKIAPFCIGNYSKHFYY
jgi:hypothetical protein